MAYRSLSRHGWVSLDFLWDHSAPSCAARAARWVMVGLALMLGGLGAALAQVVPPASFDRAPQEYGSEPTFRVGLGDLDADGDLDAVFANMGFNHSQVLFNDGRGVFFDSGQQLTMQGHGVGIGDLDGDGDLDLFMTCAGYIVDEVVYNRPSRVYLNLGDGQFVDSGQDFGDTEPSGNLVQLADIDNDGDLDAFVLYYMEPSRVYLNDGTGWFAHSEMEVASGTTWVDLDGDGDADQFVKEAGIGYRAAVNDGYGGFGAWWSHDHAAVTTGHSVAFADLDQDGDVDGFDTNGTVEEEAPIHVLFNDGTGRFSINTHPTGTANRSWVVLGDVNDDAHVDAYVSQVYRPNEVWLNDGHGGFVDSGLRLGGETLTRGSALGDLDGDGDLDIFVARYDIGGAPNEVWINCTRTGRCYDRAQPCCADAELIRRPSGRRRPIVAPQALWSRTFGGPLLDTATVVKQTSDGGFIVAGYTRSFGQGDIDGWVIRLGEDLGRRQAQERTDERNTRPGSGRSRRGE